MNITKTLTKTLTKTFAWLLTVVLLAGSMPITAFADSPGLLPGTGIGTEETSPGGAGGTSESGGCLCEPDTDCLCGSDGTDCLCELGVGGGSGETTETAVTGIQSSMSGAPRSGMPEYDTLAELLAAFAEYIQEESLNLDSDELDAVFDLLWDTRDAGWDIIGGFEPGLGTNYETGNVEIYLVVELYDTDDTGLFLAFMWSDESGTYKLNGIHARAYDDTYPSLGWDTLKGMLAPNGIYVIFGDTNFICDCDDEDCECVYPYDCYDCPACFGSGGYDDEYTIEDIEGALDDELDEYGLEVIPAEIDAIFDFLENAIDHNGWQIDTYNVEYSVSYDYLGISVWLYRGGEWIDVELFLRPSGGKYVLKNFYAHDAYEYKDSNLDWTALINKIKTNKGYCKIFGVEHDFFCGCCYLNACGGDPDSCYCHEYDCDDCTCGANVEELIEELIAALENGGLDADYDEEEGTISHTSYYVLAEMAAEAATDDSGGATQLPAAVLAPEAAGFRFGPVVGVIAAVFAACATVVGVLATYGRRKRKP